MTEYFLKPDYGSVAVIIHELNIYTIWFYVYIKSCSHEVVKHKSGVIMPIPSDGTTFSHNMKDDGNAIRTNGERPRWITMYV
jgi:hypothetical protein